MDLQEFVAAKRACRRHIFKNAQVHHEPDKLINAPIWGDNLFDEESVKEVKENLILHNTTLGLRLKMFGSSQKRKASDFLDAPPRGSFGKKSRGEHRGKGGRYPKIPRYLLNWLRPRVAQHH